MMHRFVGKRLSGLVRDTLFTVCVVAIAMVIVMPVFFLLSLSLMSGISP